MIDNSKTESIQKITSILIWLMLIVFAYGFAYKNQTILLFGLSGLGIVLIVHAPLSLLTLSRWQKETVKTKLAFWGEAFFAVGQLIFGIFSIIGAIADATSVYLSSGRFWQNVSQYPFLFIFSFGMFCSLVGVSQIAANLKPEGERFVDKLENLKEIIQGIIFLIFGLFFIGLIIFVKLF